jgi:hypothetical protein
MYGANCLLASFVRGQRFRARSSEFASAHFTLWAAPAGLATNPANLTEVLAHLSGDLGRLRQPALRTHGTQSSTIHCQCVIAGDVRTQ